MTNINIFPYHRKFILLRNTSYKKLRFVRKKIGCDALDIIETMIVIKAKLLGGPR